MDEDSARLVLVLAAGCVTGAGIAVLQARAAHYRKHGLKAGCQAMYLLMIVNLQVMAFVSIVMVERLGNPIGWRFILTASIFATKGLFFWRLRAVDMEQERRSWMNMA